MKSFSYLIIVFLLLFNILSPVTSSRAEAEWKANWLTVSDRKELELVWSQSLTFLPPEFRQKSVKLLSGSDQLTKTLHADVQRQKRPTILYLHSCEGLGHHREDLKRFAKLGFVVIALNSFSRNYRPLGCYEEQERFIPFLDLAIAFQKAELDYAVQQLLAFDWIDRKNFFLVGSGLGGLVTAHYAGDEFAGHVIEGWGCRGPNPVFDGIRAPHNVRIFSSVSKNDPWYRKNEGFAVDCIPFLKDRKGAVSVVLDRPAHYVSWYPKSYRKLIRFMTRNMKVDFDQVVSDKPLIIEKTADKIILVQKWTDEAVYKAATAHYALTDRLSRLISEPRNDTYHFACGFKNRQ